MRLGGWESVLGGCGDGEELHGEVLCCASQWSIAARK